MHHEESGRLGPSLSQHMGMPHSLLRSSSFQAGCRAQPPAREFEQLWVHICQRHADRLVERSWFPIYLLGGGTNRPNEMGKMSQKNRPALGLKRPVP